MIFYPLEMHYISHHRVNAELTYELYMVQRAIQGRLFCINRTILIIIVTRSYAWCFIFGCTGWAENHRVIKRACPALRADL